MNSKAIVLPLMVCLAGAAAGADNPPADGKEIEQLIDRLVEVSEPGFGYSVYFSGSEFLPYEGTGQMGTLVLGASRSTRSPMLLKIVEKGADAVPALVKHIGDARTSKMEPVRGMQWMEFSDEYDFNRRTRQKPPQGVNRDDLGSNRDQPDHHAVTVGDLCFVALGQIVNRRFSATRYQPSGGLIVSSPTYSNALRKVVIEDWTGLTKQQHKELLVDDFVKPDHEDRRIGAYLRLAYYYPNAVGPLVLKQLAEPHYDAIVVEAFVREKLYRAKDATERKGLFDAFVAKHGEVTRQGILLQLFDDLDAQEADEQGRLSPPLKEKHDARACLQQLYGYGKTVKSGDRPQVLPVEDAMQARFIEALTHDQSRKIGDAVEKLFGQRPDDDYFAPACLTCLASRGYGAFLVEQLNKINVADPKGNPLYEKYIEAISKSREPAVREKLLDIVKRTDNDKYFMAALPAIDRSHDDLILKLARKSLADLPADTDRGQEMLAMIGERFPKEAKAIYKSFLAGGSAQRAETMCCVLWYGNPMAIEVLAPLLDDKRPIPGFAKAVRVCDRAATAISQATGTIKFDSDWNTGDKDRQIEALKQFCEAKAK